MGKRLGILESLYFKFYDDKKEMCFLFNFLNDYVLN